MLIRLCLIALLWGGVDLPASAERWRLCDFLAMFLQKNGGVSPDEVPFEPVWNPAPEEWVGIGTSKVRSRVPVGISPDKFGSILWDISNHHDHVDGVVFWGSRTHFSYGYGPSSDSDLDYHIFPRATRTSQSHVPIIRQEISRLHGQRDSLLDMNDVHAMLTEGSGLPMLSRVPSAEIEKQLFSEALKDTIGQPREVFRQRFLELLALRFPQDTEAPLAVINKEAIFILFRDRGMVQQSPTSDEMAEQLKRYGYSNVYVVP